jgi:hypothetical protein
MGGLDLSFCSTTTASGKLAEQRKNLVVLIAHDVTSIGNNTPHTNEEPSPQPISVRDDARSFSGNGSRGLLMQIYD